MRKQQIVGLLPFLVSSTLLAQSKDIPLTNWTVPPYRGAGVSGGLRTMTDISPGVGFVAMQPCRVVDTRPASGFAAGYGGPIMAANAQRDFDINSAAHCPGIPSEAAAYSLNFTVTQTAGAPGDIRVWPKDNPPPPAQLTSVLNWVAPDTTIANATIVPSGTGGSISVYVAGTATHLLVDINGYFTSVYNAGVQFVVATAIDGEAAILAGNFSAATGSHAVGGFAGGAGFVHGIQGEVGPSTLTGSSGVHGISDSTAATFGVLGETRGTGFGASGVRGIDAVSGTGSTFGVSGQTHSDNLGAAGVWGHADQAEASGGQFSNTTAGTVFAATQISGVNYGLYSGARIRGGSLDIVGLPKNFVAPHPEDAGLEIRYASVEAPTVDVYFRGTGSIVNGAARIEVPDHFRLTAREGTYMTELTPVGRPVALFVEEEGPGGIVVRGTGNTRFHYVVYAERAEIVGYEPVVKNTTFTPEALEKSGGPGKLPDSTRTLLIKNGTINADGSYNLETARAQGWTIPERAQRPISDQP